MLRTLRCLERLHAYGGGHRRTEVRFEQGRQYMTLHDQVPISPLHLDQIARIGTISAIANNVKRPRIAVADKSSIVRLGLKDLIIREERFQFVAAVASGSALLKLLEEQAIDVAVVGWSLPDMTGRDVLAQLKQQRSAVRVVIYTGADVLVQAVKFGARGFVSKRNEPTDVLRAIAAVAGGRMSFPYVDMQSLSKSPIRDLSPREYEVLTAIAEGLSNAQIAAHLGISRNTVKHHMKNIYHKLNVNNRATAIALIMSLRQI